MRFTKIKVGKEAVELAWTITDSSGATLSTNLTHADKPAPELIEALQAFKGFALELIGAPATWTDDARVSTLSLNEEKEGKTRGLIVTAVRPVAKASGRLLVLNTPHMREESENSAAAATGVYGNDVVELIAAAEKAATAYVKGDRAQAEIFPTDNSDTTRESAPATDDLSKKRNKRKPKDAGTPNEVQNREKTIPPTDEALRYLLLNVGRDIPEDALSRWSSTDRDAAQRWAEAVLASKAGTPVALDDMIEPDVVQKHATPAIWDEGKPEPLTDSAVVEISGTIERAD